MKIKEVVIIAGVVFGVLVAIFLFGFFKKVQQPEKVLVQNPSTQKVTVIPTPSAQQEDSKKNENRMRLNIDNPFESSTQEKTEEKNNNVNEIEGF